MAGSDVQLTPTEIISSPSAGDDMKSRSTRPMNSYMSWPFIFLPSALTCEKESMTGSETFFWRITSAAAERHT